VASALCVYCHIIAPRRGFAAGNASTTAKRFTQRGTWLRYPLGNAQRYIQDSLMNALSINQWEIAAGAGIFILLLALVLWLLLRNRPTAEQIEQARRRFLVQSGRLVDGMLLDICEVEGEDGRNLTMLLYSYRIGGVNYECSQEITHMQDVVDPAQVRAGFPCTVRYQPGNPHNSIVVAEEWTGLRIGLPQLPVFEDPEPPEISRLRRR